MLMVHESLRGQILRIESRRLVERWMVCENGHLLDACELEEERTLLPSPRYQDERIVEEVVH